MADNYLENKMAEHRAGAGRGSVTVLRKAGTAVFAFGRPAVFVDFGPEADAEALLRRLGEAGAHVCFAAEGASGQRLAQRTAACCAGADFTKAIKAMQTRYGAPEIYVAAGVEASTAHEHCLATGARRAVCVDCEAFSADGVTVHSVAADCADVPSAVLFLCLPQAAQLPAVSLR